VAGSGLVLQNNGSSDLKIDADGSFTFERALADAAPYNVTVLTPPANQTCGVTNGIGTIHAANVTDVAVTCVTGVSPHSIGGRVTSLVGSGLVLQNNGGDDLAIAAGEEDFTFATDLSPGAAYAVTVKTQPTNPTQTCSIANGTGVVADTDITSVSVVCSTSTHTIGGRVTGLAGGVVTLQNNGGDDLNVGADGAFTFATPVATGSPYNVIVSRNPTDPVQSCSVTNAAGIVGDADITDIVVTCATNRFRVGGSVSGLAGRGLRVRMDWPVGTSMRQVTANGVFQFGDMLVAGTPYTVSVVAQPNRPTQTCSIVSGAQGTVVDRDIDSVAISCATDSFAVGGSVTGLQGTGLVLQNNGGDNLAIVANGEFTFATPLQSDRNYDVTVLTQPSQPAQDCTVARGRGRVGSADVRDIRITCAPKTFTISGTIAGLVGTGLVLENNGGNRIEIQSGNVFAFTQPIASGSTYNVTVASSPANPSQACTVANGTGTVADANVTNVAVTCATSTFTVGGSIRGLAGSGLVLTNNGGDNLAVSGNGTFAFATPVLSNSTYAVAVAAQPTAPTQECTVTNGTGTVGANNVTNINVDCVTTEFTIGGNVSGLNGSGLVLQNNGTDNLPIAANGAFAFAGSLLTGSTYNVTVLQQPGNPSQECTVANGTGTVSNANIQNISVTCVNTMFTVGGTIAGLAGAGLVLNDGTEDLAVNADGSFAFPTQLLNGTAYTVTVRTQPTNPSQTCAVSNPTGTISGADVTSVSVNCTTDTFPVSVQVQGMDDVVFGVLVLQNNGGDDLLVSRNGNFTFAAEVPSGSAYNVTVSQSPILPAKICTVANGSGTVVDREINDISVTCAASDSEPTPEPGPGPGGPGPGPGPGGE
jgi:hypothetical protein